MSYKSEAKSSRESKAKAYMAACGGKMRASGGKVHADEAEDKSMLKKMVKPSALKVPERAKGGRLDKRRHGNVNIAIVTPKGEAGGPAGMPKMGGPMIPPGMGAGPPASVVPRPPMLPPAAGGAPGAPMRKRGGKV